VFSPPQHTPDHRRKSHTSQVRKFSRYHRGAWGACNHSGYHKERTLTKGACRRECNASSATDTFLQPHVLRFIVEVRSVTLEFCFDLYLTSKGMLSFQNSQHRWRVFMKCFLPLCSMTRYSQSSFLQRLKLCTYDWCFAYSRSGGKSEKVSLSWTGASKNYEPII
jgi:hypothetical protein